jgi:hypothetical protein
MKTLKFKGFKAEWVLEGTKTSTMRLFDDKDIQVGDDLEFINSDTTEVFARAHVTNVIEKKLGELEDIDFEGHEKWDNQDEMMKSLHGYYGDKVSLDTPVKVLQFKLAPSYK